MDLLNLGKQQYRCLITIGSHIHRVSSAIVQRYIESILSAALSHHVQMQAPAVEILAFTIKQGLAHPLQVNDR